MTLNKNIYDKWDVCQKCDTLGMCHTVTQYDTWQPKAQKIIKNAKNMTIAKLN
jgi:hypothetical protein